MEKERREESRAPIYPQMLWLFVCLVLVLAFPPPVLPLSYSQKFSMGGVHPHLPDGWDSSFGILYYDWPSRQQRISHSANSSQCLHWYQTLAPCTEYFTNVSGQVWVEVEDVCCMQACDSNCTELSTPLPRPDYAQFTSFHGFEVLNGTNTSRWDDEMDSWFTVDGGVFFKFSVPPDVAGRTDAYELYFDVASLVVGPQNPDIFRLPASCKGKCSWPYPP